MTGPEYQSTIGPVVVGLTMGLARGSTIDQAFASLAPASGGHEVDGIVYLVVNHTSQLVGKVQEIEDVSVGHVERIHYDRDSKCYS